jgi:hypothetical protein
MVKLFAKHFNKYCEKNNIKKNVFVVSENTKVQNNQRYQDIFIVKNSGDPFCFMIENYNLEVFGTESQLEIVKKILGSINFISTKRINLYLKPFEKNLSLVVYLRSMLIFDKNTICPIDHYQFERLKERILFELKNKKMEVGKIFIFVI